MAKGGRARTRPETSGPPYPQVGPVPLGGAFKCEHGQRRWQARANVDAVRLARALAHDPDDRLFLHGDVLGQRAHGEPASPRSSVGAMSAVVRHAHRRRSRGACVRDAEHCQSTRWRRPVSAQHQPWPPRVCCRHAARPAQSWPVRRPATSPACHRAEPRCGWASATVVAIGAHARQPQPRVSSRGAVAIAGAALSRSCRSLSVCALRRFRFGAVPASPRRERFSALLRFVCFVC